MVFKLRFHHAGSSHVHTSAQTMSSAPASPRVSPATIAHAAGSSVHPQADTALSSARSHWAHVGVGGGGLAGWPGGGASVCGWGGRLVAGWLTSLLAGGWWLVDGGWLVGWIGRWLVVGGWLMGGREEKEKEKKGKVKKEREEETGRCQEGQEAEEVDSDDDSAVGWLAGLTAGWWLAAVPTQAGQGMPGLFGWWFDACHLGCCTQAGQGMPGLFC